jgi:hypothetical protein
MDNNGQFEQAQQVNTTVFLYPHFYLQAVQMQVHSANGVMGGEAGREAPSSTPL